MQFRNLPLYPLLQRRGVVVGVPALPGEEVVAPLRQNGILFLACIRYGGGDARGAVQTGERRQRGLPVVKMVGVGLREVCVHRAHCCVPSCRFVVAADQRVAYGGRNDGAVFAGKQLIELSRRFGAGLPYLGQGFAGVGVQILFHMGDGPVQIAVRPLAFVAENLIVRLGGDQIQLAHALTRGKAIHEARILKRNELSGGTNDKDHVALIQIGVGSFRAGNDGIVEAGGIHHGNISQRFLRQAQVDASGKGHQAAVGAHIGAKLLHEPRSVGGVDDVRAFACGKFLKARGTAHALKLIMRCREAVVLDASGRLPAKPFLIVGCRLSQTLDRIDNFFRGFFPEVFNGLTKQAFVLPVVFLYLSDVVRREILHGGGIFFAPGQLRKAGRHGRCRLGQHVLPVKENGIEQGGLAGLDSADDADAQQAVIVGERGQALFQLLGSADAVFPGELPGVPADGVVIAGGYIFQGGQHVFQMFGHGVVLLSSGTRPERSVWSRFRCGRLPAPAFSVPVPGARCPVLRRFPG